MNYLSWVNIYDLQILSTANQIIHSLFLKVVTIQVIFTIIQIIICQKAHTLIQYKYSGVKNTFTMYLQQENLMLGSRYKN